MWEMRRDIYLIGEQVFLYVGLAHNFSGNSPAWVFFHRA